MRQKDPHFDGLPEFEKERLRGIFCASVGLRVPPDPRAFQDVVTPGSSASQQKPEDRLSEVSDIIDKVPARVREAMLMSSPSAHRGKSSRRPARLPALPTSTPKRLSRSQPTTARQEHFPDTSPLKRRVVSPVVLSDSEPGSPVKRSRHGSKKGSHHKERSHYKGESRHKHRSRKPSPESSSESTESSTSEDTRRRRKERRKKRRAHEAALAAARRGKKRRESSDDEDMDDLAGSIVQASLLG